MEEITMKKCPLDTNANAMVIWDYGKTHFDYDEEKGFVMKFDRILKIKIFTKEGYDQADFEIKLWKDGTEKEKITNLKAFTYNIEDGKVVREKLKNEDVYTENSNKNEEKVKFSMPKVQEGSVIELEYSIASSFYFALNTWYFQKSVPVAWSECITEIPEYYNYKRTLSGYIALTINEQDEKVRSVTITDKSRSGGYVVTTQINSNSTEYREFRERMVAVDVPAFIEEEPLSSKENFISKLEFELSSIRRPDMTFRIFTQTWEDINKLLMNHDDFGSQLKGSGYMKSAITEITAKTELPGEKMVLAFEFIKDRMKWNEDNSIFTTKNLDKVFTERTGNSADINLMLTLLLMEVGLDANPVILSTRAHGIIHPAQPSVSGFNYVIAGVNIEGKTYLLDATEPYLPAGQLPFRAMNSQGRKISKDVTEWVSLESAKPYKVFSIYTLNFNEDGTLNGNLQFSYRDHAALRKRNKIGSLTNEEYIEKLENELPGLEIDSINIANRDSYTDPLNEVMQVHINDMAEGGGDIFYLNALLFEAIKENPFKLAERNYPVEYAWTTDITYSLTLTIPDGYTVTELPAAMNIKLDENAGSFLFTSGLSGNTVTISSKFSLGKKVFLPEEYQYLKDFYNEIIAKHSEKIVITKK